MKRGRVRAPRRGQRRKFGLYLDRETIRALRMAALEEDVSASAIVERLVREWLAGRKPVR